MTVDESLAIYRAECVRGEVERFAWWRHLDRVKADDGVHQTIAIQPGGWFVVRARKSITAETTTTLQALQQAGYILSVRQADKDQVVVTREKLVQLRRKQKRAKSGGRRSRGR